MSFLQELGEAAQYVASEISSHLLPGEKHSHTHYGWKCSAGLHTSKNRYDSFAPAREGNNVKWFVDGCGYFWAVSEALEKAKESVWILDWWLSPELYLRRPPSKNEQYRLDRMLQAAARRGVKINVIVYKEVALALTREFINPKLPDYLHSQLPASTSKMWKNIARAGLDVTFRSLEIMEANYPLATPPIAVNSEHTKHALEELHENIAVFRHPDHLPEEETWVSSFRSAMRNMKNLSWENISKLPEDFIKAFRGVQEDIVLYWVRPSAPYLLGIANEFQAHHEKLCIVDGEMAFMGGLDLCFGRWDTNQHSIADAHPGNLDLIVFPGQDYNNARIMDFKNVNNWQDNKLNRRTNSRMGWSDLSFSLSGPVVDDLRTHFVQRWNFIYGEKYAAEKNSRYGRLEVPIFHEYAGHHRYQYHSGGLGGIRDEIRDRVLDNVKDMENRLGYGKEHSQPSQPMTGAVPCQIVRSCTQWSHGVELEHSIANAYIEIIKKSRHFVYIENQFFITATANSQHAVSNKIGAAIVERITRAARQGDKYKMIVVIPALPGFAGDLRSDESSSARAVLKFQYESICRGEHSIFEALKREKINPSDYISFYNLRNYDRINSSATMKEAEEESGVSYEDARKQEDDILGAGYGSQGEGTDAKRGQTDLLDRYKRACAAQASSHPQDSEDQRWDSVAECYMLNGQDIRSVPWRASDIATAEIDAFVSEELYIHTKLLIADDQIIICGSANLNDRSQLGSHDSEIAVIIEDPEGVESSMAGQPWRASKFAASLRRQLSRKHLGLLPAQDMQQPDDNFRPIDIAPNSYDWGSKEDRAVADPLSEDFLALWNKTAQTNTKAFAKVFHPVPDDRVRTWKDYQEFYEKYFPERTKEEDEKNIYLWGHVVKQEFSDGPEGAKEVKEELSKIRGTLVEMQLHFLEKEDIAPPGVALNYFTDEVYT